MMNYNDCCWNVRVNVELNQGGRKYMEDVTSVKFERSELDGKIIEYAAFGIYDGHGGRDAAFFARDHLLTNLKRERGFYSNCATEIKQAIADTFHATHQGMWNNRAQWPKTAMGHESTAGTTASVAVIRGSKLYVANVGDSMVVLGIKNTGEPIENYKSISLTVDHKPELEKEKARIEQHGGQVMQKAGINRVVWLRPHLNPRGQIRRSTKPDRIPFLSISRSLGDFWSYNSEKGEFIVSPTPDVYDYDLKPGKSQFLILASDGLWNMVTPARAVKIVAKCEEEKQQGIHNDGPANALVKAALTSWKLKNLRADNTSVVTVILDRKRNNPNQRPSKELYCDSWVSGKDVCPPPVQEDRTATNSTKEAGKTDPATLNIKKEPLQDDAISSSQSADEGSTAPRAATSRLRRSCRKRASNSGKRAEGTPGSKKMKSKEEKPEAPSSDEEHSDESDVAR